MLLHLISMIWKTGIIPEEWKKSASIRIHKNGSCDELGNFWPITLDSEPLKIFTAGIRDIIFDFLMRSSCIDCKLQKGLLLKVSGTFEHAAYTINQARKKQKSVVITLLDLKHAFGEVHYNLIIEVFKYHHNPEFIQTLISNLYTDF